MKEVGAVARQETSQYIECTCDIQWYTILVLGLDIFCNHKFEKTKTVSRIPLLEWSQNYVVYIGYKILHSYKIV